MFRSSSELSGDKTWPPFLFIDSPSCTRSARSFLISSQATARSLSSAVVAGSASYCASPPRSCPEKADDSYSLNPRCSPRTFRGFCCGYRGCCERFFSSSHTGSATWIPQRPRSAGMHHDRRAAADCRFLWPLGAQQPLDARKLGGGLHGCVFATDSWTARALRTSDKTDRHRQARTRVRTGPLGRKADCVASVSFHPLSTFSADTSVMLDFYAYAPLLE